MSHKIVMNVRARVKYDTEYFKKGDIGTVTAAVRSFSVGLIDGRAATVHHWHLAFRQDHEREDCRLSSGARGIIPIEAVELIRDDASNSVKSEPADGMGRLITMRGIQRYFSQPIWDQY